MSKYKQITTQITERNHITQSLDEMGIPYHVVEATETALYEAYFRQDSQTITNAVLIKSYTDNPFAEIPFSDIAWVYDENGSYKCLYDEHGQEDIINGVAQRAAMLKLQDLAFANGYDLNIVEDNQNVQRVLVGRQS